MARTTNLAIVGSLSKMARLDKTARMVKIARNATMPKLSRMVIRTERAQWPKCVETPESRKWPK